MAGRRMWDRWTQSVRPVAERMDVSYGQTSLPVWFFRPDNDHRPRPTLILTNGSDGQSVDMWVYGAAAALDRGWIAVVFEGPGQGEPLFVNKIPCDVSRRADPLPHSGSRLRPRAVLPRAAEAVRRHGEKFRHLSTPHRGRGCPAALLSNGAARAQRGHLRLARSDPPPVRWVGCDRMG